MYKDFQLISSSKTPEESDSIQLSSNETKPESASSDQSSANSLSKNSISFKSSKLVQCLRQLAKSPTTKLSPEDADTLNHAVTQHKTQSHKTAAPSQILGKRLQGLPTESETKKRQRLQEIKEYEGGKKCLSPSIFRKSRGPILFSTMNSSTSNFSTIDATVKGLQVGSKKAEGVQPVRDLSITDFDINQCLDLKDVYKQSYKCFDNYLSLVSQLYYGLPQASTVGKGKGEVQLTSLGAPLKKTVEQQITIDQNGSQNEPQQKISKAMSSSESEILPSNGAFIQYTSPSRDENRFKLTTFDDLINPLRADNPFEIWSPKEIALFEACICRFGKNFYQFRNFIKSKSEKEIVDFYQVWKKTSHYKCWKNKQDKRKVTSNQNEWVFQ